MMISDRYCCRYNEKDDCAPAKYSVVKHPSPACHRNSCWTKVFMCTQLHIYLWRHNMVRWRWSMAWQLPFYHLWKATRRNQCDSLMAQYTAKNGRISSLFHSSLFLLTFSFWNFRNLCPVEKEKSRPIPFYPNSAFILCSALLKTLKHFERTCQIIYLSIYQYDSTYVCPLPCCVMN